MKHNIVQYSVKRQNTDLLKATSVMEDKKEGGEKNFCLDGESTTIRKLWKSPSGISSLLYLLTAGSILTKKK